MAFFPSSNIPLEQGQSYQSWGQGKPLTTIYGWHSPHQGCPWAEQQLEKEAKSEVQGHLTNRVKVLHKRIHQIGRELAQYLRVHFKGQCKPMLCILDIKESPKDPHRLHVLFSTTKSLEKPPIPTTLDVHQLPETIERKKILIHIAEVCQAIWLKETGEWEKNHKKELTQDLQEQHPSANPETVDPTSLFSLFAYFLEPKETNKNRVVFALDAELKGYSCEGSPANELLEIVTREDTEDSDGFVLVDMPESGQAGSI